MSTAAFSNIVKRSFLVLVYFFAIFGLLDLAGRLIFFPLTGMFFGYVYKLPHDYDVQEIVISGDGAYKAIIYYWSGPAFDAGCDKMVAVVNALAPVQTSWTPNHLVYKAGCDTFFKIHWEPPGDGRVTPRLRIEADAGKGDLMSRLAMDGDVAVVYRNDP